MAVVAVLEDLAAARRLLASLRDSPSLGTASAAQARALVAKLGAGVACSTGEVAELVAAAQSVHWASAEHLRAVESAAVAVATTLAAGRSHRRPMQNFESLPSYGTRAMWDRMLAGDRDALLQHAARLGLRCPSEPTMQRLAAVSLIASEGPEKAMATSTAVRQAYFRSLKRAFKAYATGEPTVYVVSLPDSPRLLRSLHRELYDAVYAAEGPVECPFAADCIHGVSVFKMRGAAAAPPPAYSEGAQQMGCWAQALMQGFQMMLSGATPLLVNQRSQPVILTTPPSQGLRAVLDASPAPSADREVSLTQVPSCAPPTSSKAVDASTPTKALCVGAGPSATPAKTAVAKRSVEDAAAALVASMAKRKSCGGTGDTPPCSKPAVMKRPSGRCLSAEAKDSDGEEGAVVATTKALGHGESHKPPSFSVERSRSQALCRTGLRGPGQSHRIPYGPGLDCPTEAAAVKQAKAWVRAQRVTRGL